MFGWVEWCITIMVVYSTELLWFAGGIIVGIVISKWRSNGSTNARCYRKKLTYPYL